MSNIKMKEDISPQTVSEACAAQMTRKPHKLHQRLAKLTKDGEVAADICQRLGANGNKFNDASAASFVDAISQLVAVSGGRVLRIG